MTSSPSLDKKKNNCIRPCGGFSFRGVFLEGNTKRTVFTRMYCKRWNCPDCGPRRAWQLQQDIAENAKKHDLSRLMTLTLDPRRIRGDPYKHINESWRKLREAFRRKFKRPLSFIAVTEFTKKGLPHKHVLIDEFIKQSWLSQRWQNLGGGRIVDIRKIGDMENVARYVGKYLTKDVFINAPKKAKRVTTSRNIKLREKEKAGEWNLCDVELDNIYERRKDQSSLSVTEKDGRLRSFEIHERLDVQFSEVCNGIPVRWNGLKPLPPKFDDCAFTKWFFQKDSSTEEDKNAERSDLCESVEQGTALGWLLNTCTGKTPDRLRSRQWHRRYPYFQGRRVRETVRKNRVQRNVGVHAAIGGLQIDPR